MYSLNFTHIWKVPNIKVELVASLFYILSTTTVILKLYLSYKETILDIMRFEQMGLLKGPVLVEGSI